MTGMERQLIKWRDDWMRFWGRTSLAMRIVIGAGVSLAITAMWLNWWNKPLAEEVKKLHRQLDKVIADNSFNLQMTAMRQRRQELKKQLQTTADKLEKLSAAGLRFEPADCGLLTAALRRRIDEYELELKEENEIIAHSPETSRRRRRSHPVRHPADEWQVRKNYPEYMKTVRYHYRLVGEFSRLIAFLRSLPTVRKAFAVNNVVLTTAPADEGGIAGLLTLDFDLSVPTLSDGANPLPVVAGEAKNE
ncbi:MAG: hypothetical protein PHQ27_02965 [Victivallales bacterium]|nr:hypothetical protein [Victivallales bacterium]